MRSSLPVTIAALPVSSSFSSNVTLAAGAVSDDVLASELAGADGFADEFFAKVSAAGDDGAIFDALSCVSASAAGFLKQVFSQCILPQNLQALVGGAVDGGLMPVFLASRAVRARAESASRAMHSSLIRKEVSTWVMAVRVDCTSPIGT